MVHHGNPHVGESTVTGDLGNFLADVASVNRMASSFFFFFLGGGGGRIKKVIFGVSERHLGFFSLFTQHTFTECQLSARLYTKHCSLKVYKMLSHQLLSFSS